MTEIQIKVDPRTPRMKQHFLYFFVCLVIKEMAKLSYTFLLTRYCIIFVFMRGDKYYFSKITLQKHTFENFGRLWKSNDFLLPKSFDSNTKVTSWIWISFYLLLFLDFFCLKKYCRRCQSNVELSPEVLIAWNSIQI